MRVHLLFRGKPLDLNTEDPWGSETLIRDLDLEPMLDAMAGGDRFIREVARKTLLLGAPSIEDILYRQEAMRDVLRSPEVIRAAYKALTDAVNKARSLWWLPRSRSTPASTISYSTKLLEVYIEGIERVREILLTRRPAFKSEAFTSLIRVLDEYFDEAYTRAVREALKYLDIYEALSIKVSLARNAELRGFKLIKPTRRAGLKKILSRITERRYSWSLPPRDDAGAKELEDMKNLALEGPARILSISYQHVLEFIKSLRAELAFYVGALNLWDHLRRIGVPLSFPTPHEAGQRVLRFKDLVEVSLALRTGRRPVGNTIDSEGRPLILVSGPNRGGKTVFLRSIGQAQLMMMAGMFVAAEHFESSISPGIYTHFRAEEKANLSRGRLEEELARMSEIIDHLKPGSILLMNESFSSTNEREGSEIAREIVCALIERGIKVIYVTHFYEIQRWFLENRRRDTLFLRAERREDGTRTYRILPSMPEKSNYAEEIYRKIFEAEPPSKAQSTTIPHSRSLSR